MNNWLRLWHDMPTDPKFRTIAKISKQPLSAVLAMYIYLLVDASNATERGRTQANDENVASAIDLEIDQVKVIREAMQGRVLYGNYLTGWEKRQPKREDKSAERSKAWREMQKNHPDLPNATERNRTKTNASERQDKDKDKEVNINKFILSDLAKSDHSDDPSAFEKFWKSYPRREKKKNAHEIWNRKHLDSRAAEIIADVQLRKTEHGPWLDGYIPHATTYLNGERWNDEVVTTRGNSPKRSSKDEERDQQRKEFLERAK